MSALGQRQCELVRGGALEVVTYTRALICLAWAHGPCGCCVAVVWRLCGCCVGEQDLSAPQRETGEYDRDVGGKQTNLGR